MPWFYTIHGKGNRLVKREGSFKTEQEAISAGNTYLKSNKATIMDPADPKEVFTIVAGRNDFIHPDPASVR